MVLILMACLIVALSAPAVSAGELTGRACIVDGATLMLGGKRRHTKCEGGKLIQLWGVTAFGLKQRCQHPGGRDVMCGLYSAAQLQEKVKTQEIRCEEKATKFGGIIVAECFLGEDNLNRYMVENGYALADGKTTERFTGYEAQAKAQRRGLWVTTFKRP